MAKKICWIALSAVVLALSFPAEAQRARKVYRIGWVRFLSAPPTDPAHVAFRQRLRELGYVEGQNLVIEYRSAEGKPERRFEAAAELVRLKVDVILTSPAPPLVRDAQRATRTLPIVVAGLYVDPVEAGFVASLARPGGNITGLTNVESELHAKRLELLKESFPRISHVAILWPQYQQKPAKKDIEAAGEALGIKIQSLVANEPLDIETVFSAISRERPDGLLVASSALTLRHRARIIDFAAKRRLPTIYAQSRFADAGGLMSYDADLPDLFRRAAAYVDKILRGAKPGDLPVEQPTKFDLVINLKTAKQLDLTIAPEILMRADRVIR
ncbi:MAG: ABC transporter substrate-binding protein [Deltaproteobacteria bacterium]|nr:ABC transporter substrate-binding protein [Deltaproteobacteria bacterium]